MVPSRILAVPGLRTSARPSWRAAVGTALAVVAGQPHLWLLGASGFALRGGIVLLTLPILVLPTQVEVRLALGNYLGSTGLTPAFWAVVAIGSALTALIALSILLLLASIEIPAFRHLVADAETGDIRGWRPAYRMSVADHRALLSRVFVVQALGLLLLGLFALPLAASVGQATLDELLRPSSSASIYVRVFGHISLVVLLFFIGVAVVEAVTAVATRQLTLRAHGFTSGVGLPRRRLMAAIVFGLARPLRSPIRTMRTAALGWLSTLLALIPALWAIDVAWQATRASFLATTSMVELGSDVDLLVIALLLAAVFLGGLLLCGFASAFRASLWSIDSLNEGSSAAVAVD